MTSFPLTPTAWNTNPYQAEWAERDFFYSPDGTKEFPRHCCKRTYLLSKPHIRQFRNALDIGCRVGEYTRYLHLDFAHVYAFDPNLWPKFAYNVDLANVTHFKCAIGNREETITMFGGSHNAIAGQEGRQMPAFTVDQFGFTDIDYIKIDVEGFEKKVLEGAAQTIDASNPLIVIEQNEVTIEGEGRYAAKDYLQSIGYTEVAVDKRGWDFIMVRT